MGPGWLGPHNERSPFSSKNQGQWMAHLIDTKSSLMDQLVRDLRIMRRPQLIHLTATKAKLLILLLPNQMVDLTFRHI